ncbi:hypothetical protein L1987_48859 [Smallanthus sonchifolius]|uniref:Uncharacterized protein n=1 Tax=Smallanthus sonchifolius TaxID=185202 RepID=A0ACB9FSG6_9ASTR|nr:hypothetical protein L1987_48859 [Smallanthus sonchifolius]
MLGINKIRFNIIVFKDINYHVVDLVIVMLCLDLAINGINKVSIAGIQGTDGRIYSGFRVYDIWIWGVWLFVRIG